MSSLSWHLVCGFVTYARRANGSPVHRIDGYSILAEACRTGEVLRSVPFRVGGHKWQLLLYPNGVDADHQGFVSANLRLVSWSFESKATATYRVSIIDFVRNPAHSRTVGPWCHFEGISSSTSEPSMKTGVYELVAAEELLMSAPFLLRNDCLNVQCDVSVLKTESRRWNRWFVL